MDYSVHYVPRNDGETDAALVVRRGAHELSFTEAAAWTAIKGWLAPMGEAAEDVPFGCVAQYTLPSVVLDADAYSTRFIECIPTDAGFSRWQQTLATMGCSAAGGQDFSAAIEYFDSASGGFTADTKTALRLRAADFGQVEPDPTFSPGAPPCAAA